MIAYELENSAVPNVKSIHYRCVIGNMAKNDAIHTLNKSKLDDQGSL